MRIRITAALRIGHRQARRVAKITQKGKVDRFRDLHRRAPVTAPVDMFRGADDLDDMMSLIESSLVEADAAPTNELRPLPSVRASSTRGQRACTLAAALRAGERSLSHG